MYSSCSTSLSIDLVMGEGWKVLTKLVKLALMRALGLSKHLETPIIKSSIAAASNLLSAEGDQDLVNT